MNLDQDRVPASVEEALRLLGSGLTKREREAWTGMTAAQMFKLQYELARTLRWEWSLDDANTPLRLFFRELGLDYAEEVSLLLIDAYWRMHNNEPKPIHELVAEYLED